MKLSWIGLIAVCVGTAVYDSPKHLLAGPTTAPAFIHAGDLVTVKISDLEGVGIETTKEARVDKDGMINLLLVGSVKVDGLSEVEAEREIVKAYSDKKLIHKAEVHVELKESGKPSTQPTTQANP